MLDSDDAGECLRLKATRRVSGFFYLSSNMKRAIEGVSPDEEFMRLALKLARRGMGKVEPNPMVGAVIVKNNRIVSTGWHRFFGGLHAEAEAIKNLMKKNPAGWRKILKGSTLYVNLEPCCHSTKEKKTPPCVPLIIESGIKKVVSGMIDPNPSVSGKGLALLRRSGISVTRSILLEKDCRELNKVYIKNMTSSMPYVLLKAAMTLDGKIATRTGDSRWITSEISRRYVHKLRSQYDAVLVGIGTVLKDNPLLTTHGLSRRDPIVVVIDPSGKTPPTSRIFRRIMRKPDKSQVILITTRKGKNILLKKKFLFQKPEIINFPTDAEGKINFRRIMKTLYSLYGIRKILIEGGGNTNWEAVKSGVVDEYLFFIAPKIIGGSKSVTPVEGGGYSKIKFARNPVIKKFFRLGNDIVINASGGN